MTYHVSINKNKIDEFLQILKSLKKLGVVESITSSSDLVGEGDPLEHKTLLSILDKSEQEIKDGNLFTIEDIKKQIERWKKK